MFILDDLFSLRYVISYVHRKFLICNDDQYRDPCLSFSVKGVVIQKRNKKSKSLKAFLLAVTSILYMFHLFSLISKDQDFKKRLKCLAKNKD